MWIIKKMMTKVDSMFLSTLTINSEANSAKRQEKQGCKNAK